MKIVRRVALVVVALLAILFTIGVIFGPNRGGQAITLAILVVIFWLLQRKDRQVERRQSTGTQVE